MSQRPAIVGIHESADDERASVEITLGWRDATYAGSAAGPPDPEARPRIVGEAALRAVEAVTDGRIRLGLAAVATTDLGASQIATAQVQIVGTDDSFVGSAFIDHTGPAEATVKAVLDAINRRMERLI